MSSSILCENNGFVMECALKLDRLDQTHVRDMIEWVLQPNSKLAGLEPSFYHVLSMQLSKCFQF